MFSVDCWNITILARFIESYLFSLKFSVRFPSQPTIYHMNNECILEVDLGEWLDNFPLEISQVLSPALFTPALATPRLRSTQPYGTHRFGRLHTPFGHLRQHNSVDNAWYHPSFLKTHTLCYIQYISCMYSSTYWNEFLNEWRRFPH